MVSFRESGVPDAGSGDPYLDQDCSYSFWTAFLPRLIDIWHRNLSAGAGVTCGLHRRFHLGAPNRRQRPYVGVSTTPFAPVGSGAIRSGWREHINPGGRTGFDLQHGPRAWAVRHRECPPPPILSLCRFTPVNLPGGTDRGATREDTCA